MSALGVRCHTCGTPGLPPVPASKLGAGELTHPVAHVHLVHGPRDTYFAPCMYGLSLAELHAASAHPRVLEVKEMIWRIEALWEL